MKILSFFLLLLLSSSIFSQKPDNIIIISDLDDTYKITNSGHIFPALFNITFTKKSFAGNAMLYKELTENGDNLIILSKTPEIFRKRVEILLKKDSLNPMKIILKKHSDNSDTYKVEAITEIISKNPEAKFILIGDDVTHDHEVYDSIYRKFSDKILNIYIRPVKNRNLPVCETKFVTAYDIAIYEYLCGRFDLNETLFISEKILNEKKSNRIKPHFIKNEFICNFENLPVELEKKLSEIKNLIEKD
jgi:hypothetical protein